MSPSSPSSLSLFQLARTYPDPPTPLRVWARGFKGILQSGFNYLIDQNRSGICWFKLPSGESWQADAHRYLQQMGTNTTAYWLKAGDDEPQGNSTQGAVVPLTPDYKLRGEYCLLAIAEGFSLAILARRFRVTPDQDFLPPGTSDNTENIDDIVVDLGALTELRQEQKHYLKVIVSVNPGLVRHVLTGVKDLVAASAAAYPQQTEIQALNTDWDTLIQVSESVDFQCLDRLIANRFKQQEDMRQALSSLKQRASEASSLSTQNEELLNTIRQRDDFLGTVGQELRKPLANIKTALTLLSSSNIKIAQRQRYLEMISTECDRQSMLVNGVLNLLQLEGDIGQLPAKPVQLSNSLPGFISTYQPLAQEKGVTLQYTIDQDLPPIACPETWVKQIVTHLVENGIKFTPTTGQVQITAQHHGADTVQLTFRDTGVGVPAPELPQIFDCFYRGRQLPEGEAEGAGLGLTIVQQLLTYCGGSITVESQAGSGSVFQVYLPTIANSP